MKRNPKIIYLVCFLALVGVLAFRSQAQQVDPQTTVVGGEEYQLECGFKIVSIQYSGKKPMAVIRPMREGEQPEIWVIKPVKNLNDLALAGEPSIVIKECKN